MVFWKADKSKASYSLEERLWVRVLNPPYDIRASQAFTPREDVEGTKVSKKNKKKMAKKIMISVAIVASFFLTALAANAAVFPAQAGTGFTQFNGLSVVSVSSNSVPATITATLQPYSYTSSTTSSIFVNDSAGTCYSYSNQSSANRTLEYCPMYQSSNNNADASANNTTNGTNQSNSSTTNNGSALNATSTTNASSTNNANLGNQNFASQMNAAGTNTSITNHTDNNRTTNSFNSSTTYRIEVNASNEIMLRDGTRGNPANITPGDTINVFGYYNGNGVIDATSIQDLSKPSTFGNVTSTTAGTNISGATLSNIEAEIQIISNEIATIRTEIANGVR